MLSIIIPTKNESYINALVSDIRKKVRAKHEIVVVDKSDALPKIKGAKLVRQKSAGLGRAILEGVAASKGDIILMMDGDGSHDPAYIDKMLSLIKNYDVVIGSRYVKDGSSNDTLPRTAVSKLLTAAATVILGLGIKDPMSGFAMYRRKIFDSIMLSPKGYKLLMEICYKYRKSGRSKIMEVPIAFHPRKYGRSKVGFNLDGLKEFTRIVSLMLSLRFERD